MTDWKALTHAYGEASDIPVRIDELRRDPSSARWSDLWSRLCHQGTVYSASHAALPLLCALAKASSPADRLDPLMLIGAIVASDDLYGVAHRPVELIASLLPDLQHLVDETMRSPGLKPETFVYYLQAASALAGDFFWGRSLDHLNDGEFPGRCPACKHDLYLVVGAHGFFVTATDYAKPQLRKLSGNPITPAAQYALAARAAWLHTTSLACDQPRVALWLRHVFGTAICPACDCVLNVADAIATER